MDISEYCDKELIIDGLKTYIISPRYYEDICWSINMLRTFLTQKERMYVKWLYVSVFGILIIGMAEPVAFMHSEWCYSGILVFMISGYLTGRRRLL